MKHVPTDMLPIENFGDKAGEALLWIDSQAGGVVSEVAKVYQKVETGQEIPIRFIRDGKEDMISFAVR